MSEAEEIKKHGTEVVHFYHQHGDTLIQNTNGTEVVHFWKTRAHMVCAKVLGRERHFVLELVW